MGFTDAINDDRLNLLDIAIDRGGDLLLKLVYLLSDYFAKDVYRYAYKLYRITHLTV